MTSSNMYTYTLDDKLQYTSCPDIHVKLIHNNSDVHSADHIRFLNTNVPICFRIQSLCVTINRLLVRMSYKLI